MNDEAYILLFRGINVGGNKVVPMARLRAALERAGFREVTTYIQSGNAVLKSDLPPDQVVALVERQFVEEFGFASRPTVRSFEGWRQMIARSPFPVASGKLLHAVLLDARPSAAAVRALESLAETERIALRDGVLYLHTPDGFGRSKVAAALDRVLAVPLTARNWNTVLKLEQMAAGLASGR